MAANGGNFATNCKTDAAILNLTKTSRFLGLQQKKLLQSRKKFFGWKWTKINRLQKKFAKCLISCKSKKSNKILFPRVLGHFWNILSCFFVKTKIEQFKKILQRRVLQILFVLLLFDKNLLKISSLIQPRFTTHVINQLRVNKNHQNAVKRKKKLFCCFFRKTTHSVRSLATVLKRS